MNRKTLRPGLAALSVLVLALAAAGCGDDSDDASNTRTESTETTDGTDDAATETTDGGGEDLTVEVRAVDHGFEGLPESVSAGTTLTLVNESTDEVHELVAMRLPDDEERSVEELLELPPEDDEAPPDLVLVAPPGEEGEAVLGDGTLTEPGRYAIICAIPTGADPEEFMAAAEEASDGPPEVDGGPPHFVHGMHAELVVE